MMEDERGEDRTVPKGSKAEEVSGRALTVMVDVSAIVEVLQMDWACAVLCLTIHACTSSHYNTAPGNFLRALLKFGNITFRSSIW